MKNIIHKIIKSYRKDGFEGLLTKSKNYLSEKVYFRKYIWFEKDLAGPAPILYPKIEAQFVFDSGQKINEFLDERIYHGNPPDDEKYERKIALENGHFITSAQLNGKIICYRKIGRNNVYIKNFDKTVKLIKGTAFAYSLYTDPEYRKLGLAGFLLSKSIEPLKNNGLTKMANQVRSSNIAAINLVKKCNWSQIAESWHVKFFGLNIISRLPSSIFIDK